METGKTNIKKKDILSSLVPRAKLCMSQLSVVHTGLLKKYSAELVACGKNIPLLCRPQSLMSPSGMNTLISHLKQARIELILNNTVESGMV